MEKKKETLSELIGDYKKEVVFIENTGELHINGNKHIPYEKQIWKPKDNK